MIRSKKLRCFILSFTGTLLVLLFAAGLFFAEKSSSKVGFEKKPGIIEIAAADDSLSVSIMGEKLNINLGAANSIKAFVFSHETFWPKKLRFWWYAGEYFGNLINK